MIKQGILIGLIIAALTTEYAHAIHSESNPPLVRARKFAVTTTESTISFASGKIQRVDCLNGGNNAIRMHFNADVDTHWYEAPSGGNFPTFLNYPGLDINLKSVGGSSNIQCIIQSKL